MGKSNDPYIIDNEIMTMTSCSQAIMQEVCSQPYVVTCTIAPASGGGWVHISQTVRVQYCLECKTCISQNDSTVLFRVRNS